jgi:hypothetical protein
MHATFEAAVKDILTGLKGRARFLRLFTADKDGNVSVVTGPVKRKKTPPSDSEVETPEPVVEIKKFKPFVEKRKAKSNVNRVVQVGDDTDMEEEM